MAELVLYALPKMIAEVCIDEQNRNQPENNKKLVINPKWCKGCGICAAFCPKKVLGLDEETEKATVVNQEACIACYMCELRCPDLAIKVIKEGDK